MKIIPAKVYTACKLSMLKHQLKKLVKALSHNKYYAIKLYVKGVQALLEVIKITRQCLRIWAL